MFRNVCSFDCHGHGPVTTLSVSPSVRPLHNSSSSQPILKFERQRLHVSVRGWSGRYPLVCFYRPPHCFGDTLGLENLTALFPFCSNLLHQSCSVSIIGIVIGQPQIASDETNVLLTVDDSRILLWQEDCKDCTRSAQSYFSVDADFNYEIFQFR